MKDLQIIKEFLEGKGLKLERAEIDYVPKEKITLNDEDLQKIEKFIEELEDNEDVNDYYTNLN